MVRFRQQRWWRWLVVLIVAGLAAWAWTGQSRRDAQALADALARARVAPLPATAKDVEVVATGSGITREVVVRFRAPPADISAWLAGSPGPSQTPPQTNESQRTYHVEPGEGATSAQIIVDDLTGEVTIRTSWQ